MWKSDEILSKYEEQLDSCKYVSFDIFDTLLLRAVDNPVDIFLEVGKAALENGHISRELREFEFKQIRILSQKKARTLHGKNYNNIQLDNEISLKDIYEQMPRNMGNLDEIMKLEIEVEKEYTYINPVIYDLIKYLNSKGKKIFLISDMYLSKEQIKYILKNNAFDFSTIEELFISSEVSLNKNSGKLFKYVLNKYNINKSEIIHIGDNFNSDIQGSKKEGIESIKYGVTVDKDNSIDFENYRYGRILPEIKALRKTIRNLTATYSEEEKFWFQFGSSILGPVLTLFSEYILDKAIKNNVKSIKPFMREAVILEPLLNRAAQNKRYECYIKPLYISRLATLIPAISRITIDELDKIFDIRNIKFKDAIKVVGLDLDDLKIFNKYYDMYSKEIEKNEIKSVLEYILKNYTEKINEFIKTKRNLLIKYLKQENVESEKLMTVDVGFKGTVQESLENILRQEGIQTSMIHLITISGEQLYLRLQKGINIQTFFGIYEENIDLVDDILYKLVIIEDLMMDERGSTIGYKERENTIKPILDVNRIPKEEFTYKKVCREGILKFQNMYYDCLYNKKYMKNFHNRKREIIGVLARFASIPSLEESIKLGGLSHENSFGSTSIEKICKENDFRFLDELNYEDFLLKSKYLKVVWPEAIVTLKDSMYLQRKVIKSSSYMPMYYREIMDAVEKLKNDSVKRVIVWGAGDVGRVALDVLKKENIEVLAIIDRKEWLWDSYIDLVPIRSPDYVENKFKNIEKNVLIASFSFIDEIKAAVNLNLKNSRIYTVV